LKNARDKRACIEASSKTFNDSPPYLDIFEMDAQGAGAADPQAYHLQHGKIACARAAWFSFKSEAFRRENASRKVDLPPKRRHKKR
jgi:hypothetical protein